jgi:hypothetical protein
VPWACGGDAFTPGAATSDAGGDDVIEGGQAEDDGGPDSADGGSDGGLLHVVYVSAAAGMDSNDGLAPSRPKKTIAAGLIAASPYRLGEVHVCQGVYPESALVVAGDTILLGGYDCSTWKRTDRYGFPNFDGINQSTIQNSNVAAQSATLVVGSKVTGLTLIDGFTIQGGTSTTASTGAVLVKDEANPTLANDSIVGMTGNGGTTTYGSYGVDLEGNAGPKITLCTINGGTGSGTSGSIGVVMNSKGAPTFSDDVIYGGHGTGTQTSSPGAVGMAIVTPTTNPVTACAISGTDPQTPGTYSASSYGVTVGISSVSATTATLQACAIQGGAGAGPGQSFGVAVTTAGDVTLLADRIYGGKRTTGNTYGVAVLGVSQLTVADSMIHAGTVTGGAATGIEVLTAAKAPQIAFDTIYTGAATAGSSAILFPGSTFGAQIVDDLIIGNVAGSAGLDAKSCTNASTFGAVDNNVFVNPPLLYCATGATVTTMASTPAALTTAVTPVMAQNNVLYGGSAACTGCITNASCPGGAACLGSIFSPWSSDDGVTSLFAQQSAPDGGVTTSGWVLSSSLPCTFVNAGASLGSSLDVDINGTTRRTKPTPGAQEFTGPCL